MANSGFLKTVSIGGFDKKDVLAYVDDLNTKIYKLETELQEAKANVGTGSSESNNADLSELQKQLNDEHARANELQAKVDTLTLNVQSYENEIQDKNNEIDFLKNKVSDLEDQIASSANADTTSSVDIGNIFIEAQKTAQKIIAEQRAKARKMEEEAKQVAEQVVNEANEKAEDIINSATEKASKSVSDIEAQAEAMIKNAEFIKNSVKSEIDLIYCNITDLNDKIAEFSKESTVSIDRAKAIIDGTDLSAINDEVYNSFESIKASSDEVVSIVKEFEVFPRQSSVETQPEENAVVYDQEAVSEPVNSTDPVYGNTDHINNEPEYTPYINGIDDLAALAADVEKISSSYDDSFDDSEAALANDENAPMSLDEMARYAQSLQSQIEADAASGKPFISEL